MDYKKILILLPDGVGLRNFVFSDFPEIANQNNLKLKYWNRTDFDLQKIGLESVKLEGKPHYKTDLLKKTRKEIEVRQYIERFNNDIYWAYLFKPNSKNIKTKLKENWIKRLIKRYTDNLSGLREKIKKQERRTEYYNTCLQQLKAEDPDLVFCTNQRPVQAISPILASQDLGIPTVTFIFSWDNLPKATMVIETDYYMVWSDFMANQLKEYYPYVDDKQILVTGSPQFELHFKEDYKLSRSEFCIQHKLPENSKFICFSGDDITTSPHDPIYLNDVCEAIKQLNAKGNNFAILFRPCPVDFSDRYDSILAKHKDVVFRIRPKWEKQGKLWNTVLPTLKDQSLLYNTILHSELIINLGSSMVFDAACHNKACVYINYNPEVNALLKDVNNVYKYVHFDSMPSKNAVVWINSKEEIYQKIQEGINKSEVYIKEAKKWFEIICKQPAEKSSLRFAECLNDIINR